MSLGRGPVPRLTASLAVMNELLAHRGPDGEGTWEHPSGRIGLANRRLAIIDLEHGDQPMTDAAGNWLVHNGEIYNYVELRESLGVRQFRTHSDTEAILAAYGRWGTECAAQLRGMFAFALWDERQQALFCARDRFGIKPFYYVVVGGCLYFASEVKALLPFLPRVDTSPEALADYLTFQFCLDGKTLFEGVEELRAGHVLLVRDGLLQQRRYWEVYYEPDMTRSEDEFVDATRRLLEESVAMHLRSDVPVGAYLSGGLDSSIVTSLAAQTGATGLTAFAGRFAEPGYDESRHARTVASSLGVDVREVDIQPEDLVERLETIVYHLDFPVAGPGSFPQYFVSEAAAQERKVLLGGQGADEIFGGYVRYLIAYFERCIKGAIDDTMRAAPFVVTYESIIPNLVSLRGYEPLLQEFWQEGVFDEFDARYFRLVDRSRGLADEVRWEFLGDYSPFEAFRRTFHGENVRGESAFDSMTHFDFKTLLPALLHVEDRVGMAHGLEARVPFLDHPLVELAATMPAIVKFKDGEMKYALRRAAATRPLLPPEILARKDKMGFPVPLREWVGRPGPVRNFVFDVLGSSSAASRALIDNGTVLARLDDEPQFGRRLWGFLCLELWQRVFHDRAASYRERLADAAV